MVTLRSAASDVKKVPITVTSEPPAVVPLIAWVEVIMGVRLVLAVIIWIHSRCSHIRRGDFLARRITKDPHLFQAIAGASVGLLPQGEPHEAPLKLHLHIAGVTHPATITRARSGQAVTPPVTVAIIQEGT